MRKIAILVVVVISIILLGSTGCSSGAEVAIEKIPINTAMISISQITSQVNGNNAFAFDLYQKIKDSKSNLFYSPYSISIALAMTYAGARGDTAKQMAAALHFKLPDSVLHTAMYSLQQDLEKRNNNQTSQLSIANALWGQKGKYFLSEYVNQIDSYYNGSFKTLDFVKSTEQSRKEINKWVSDKTNNRINELLKQESVDTDTALVITNAVYFKAPWKFIFGSTNDESFYTLDGKNIIVPMMKHDVMRFEYFNGGNCQAIDLPYRDCDLSMLIILPDDGQYTDFEKSLDDDQLNTIVGSLKDTLVVLRMPKFKFEANYLLNENLKALGMIDAFGNADFSGMTDTPGLFIDKVLHSTFISVDEKGTEAAAGVGAMVAGAGATNIVINRPFIFLIRDSKTGTILFMGRVLNPIS